MKKISLASLGLLIAMSASAETFDLSGRFGVGGGAGWAIPVLGNRFDDIANEDLTWNAHARYHWSAANAIIFQYSQHQFNDTSVNAKVYDATYLVRLNPVDRFTFVFGLGAGLSDLSNIRDNNSTKLALKGRGGFEYMLTRDLMASATVDYQWINKMPWSHESHANEGEIHALVPQANLTLFFGHDKEYRDEHPKAKEAPKKVAVVSTDDDKDGVVNGKDKCPGTEPGMTVNAYGCIPKEKAHIEVEVFFQTGKTELDLNSHASMQSLADFLNEHKGTKAEIQGYTDSVGSDASNRKLSQARAESVKRYLVEKLNVEPSRVSSYGYGEEKPIDSNDTAQGRARNRRVVAEISE